MAVLFIVSCSKKDTTESTMGTDSMATDSSAAIPNPAPQTDSATTAMSNTGSAMDSASATTSGRRDSAR